MVVLPFPLIIVPLHFSSISNTVQRLFNSLNSGLSSSNSSGWLKVLGSKINEGGVVDVGAEIASESGTLLSYIYCYITFCIFQFYCD